jgi:hypothetical protein
MTKKRVLWGTPVLALVFGFVLAGCTSYKFYADLGIFDVSTPMEEQCMLMIESGNGVVGVSNINIHSFDGEPVNWPVILVNVHPARSKISIPAGRHQLLYSGSYTDTSSTNYGSYTKITTTKKSNEGILDYTFEAGKTYEVGFYNDAYIREVK